MGRNTKAESEKRLTYERSREIVLCLLSHFGPMTSDEIYSAGLYMGNDGFRRKTLSIKPFPKRWPELYSLWDLSGFCVSLLVDMMREGQVKMVNGVGQWMINTKVVIDDDDLVRLQQVEQCNWSSERKAANPNLVPPTSSCTTAYKE